MATFRHFWFFEPRMVLWELGLGAGLGAIYGLILGGPPSLHWASCSARSSVVPMVRSQGLLLWVSFWRYVP
jgi:hypothetical protein